MAASDRPPPRAPVPVIVNRQGGRARTLGDRLMPAIEAAFARVDLPIDLHLLDGDAIPAAVRAHRAAPLVIVGGGDGTIGCAAGELRGETAALGILPLGTRNHLAQALGVPTGLEEATALLAEGAIRAIDLGEVNGRVFVNNASIGVYPALVEERDATRNRHAVPKWIAAIPAAWSVLKRLRHHRLRLRHDGGEALVVTPLLFVGNNRYSIATGSLGQREALDRGVLSVFAIASRRRIALIGVAIRTLIGRTDAARDFAELTDTGSLVVEGRSRHVDIALDGEVIRLAMPLRFASRAKALRVVAPLSGRAASPKSTP